MNLLASFAPNQLFAECRKNSPDFSHERFCFELFRRAIAEKDQTCWEIVYGHYTKLVGNWALEYAHGSRVIGIVTLEEMVQEAFTAFWRAYNPEHLLQAEGLGSVLCYLKSCAWSSVQQALHKQKLAALRTTHQLTEEIAISQERVPEVAVTEAQHRQRFWQLVDACCTDERERTIARLRFVEDCKPSEIVRQHPELANDEKEIFKVLRNLKDRLGRSLQMQELRKEWMA